MASAAGVETRVDRMGRHMQVHNVRWIGTATANYDAMADFARAVLGLRVNFADPTTIEYLTSEGDAFQIMGPGDPYYDFFSRHATGPVPLFEVADVHAARAELDRAGIDVVGPLGRDDNWEWLNFRAPDGHLYELASRLHRS